MDAQADVAQIETLPVIFINEESLNNNEETLATPSCSKNSISSVGSTSASTITIDSDFSLSSPSPPIIEYIDVKAILSKDLIGQALLQKGNTKNLTNSDRDKISDILVTSLLNSFSGKLSADHFKIISEKLVTLFPNEKQSTYYIAAILKKNSFRNKSEAARGKLVEKYRNKLHLLKKLEASNSDVSCTNSNKITIGNFFFVPNFKLTLINYCYDNNIFLVCTICS